MKKVFEYKSFTAYLTFEDGGVYGVFDRLNPDKIHRAKSINELEGLLKSEVERYLYHLDHYELKSKYDVKSRFYDYIPYLFMFFLGFCIIYGVFAFFQEEFPIEKIVSDVGSLESKKIKELDWWTKSSDFFNGFSAPILAFLSYIALLWTVFQQQKTQKISLEELELTRTELARAAEANKAQAVALEKQVGMSEESYLSQKRNAEIQNFENTFYNLLEQHNEILKELNYDDVIDKFNREDNLVTCFDMIHRNIDLCRYFRILYQTLKFISVSCPYNDNLQREFDESVLLKPVSKGEKFYSSLLRSYVPVDILELLAVNCCAFKGKGDSYYSYRILIQRYQFLEHISIKNSPLVKVMNKGHLTSTRLYKMLGFYQIESFGKNESISMVVKDLNKSFESCKHIKKSSDFKLYFDDVDDNVVAFSHMYSGVSLDKFTYSDESILIKVVSENMPNLDLEPLLSEKIVS